jgi:hypothetical protein
MIDLFRFRPAGLFSAALALAALDDVDHAPDETTDKAANWQRPLCGIVIGRFSSPGWSFARSVHKSAAPVP